MSDVKHKPILLLDFDGVIHKYETPWTGADVISDGPVPGAREFIKSALKHFRVCIYSARTSQPGGLLAMKRWLIFHNFPFTDLELPTEKPPAFLTIDDRCVCFTGSFPDPATLTEFKPWNKRGV